MAAEATVDELLKDGTCTVQDAEREFGFKKSRLYAWMQEGTLPYSQVGDRRYIPRRALRKLIADGLVGVKKAACVLLKSEEAEK